MDLYLNKGFDAPRRQTRIQREVSLAKFQLYSIFTLFACAIKIICDLI